MNKKVIDGKEFYLVICEYVLLDLPILGMKKDAVYRRFKKMCDKIKKITTDKESDYIRFKYGFYVARWDIWKFF